MKVTALIMAGGKGERFWPRSRKAYPKQFIDIMGCGKTMIQLTVDRILPLTAMEDIYIVTNEQYKQLVREQLPQLPEENILCEPEGRNTAPCIGLGAAYMLRRNEDAVMMVLASDHLIKQEDCYREIMKEAISVAEQEENLVTIGITPSYPETGYGYIKRNMQIALGSAREVERFVEKPNRETAEKYLQSGEYLWNSGMFVWKASTYMKAMKNFLPDIYEGLCRIQASIGTEKEGEVLRKEFMAMRSISVDYGILEKANRIYAFSGEFGWDDVGSWLAVERFRDVDESNNLLTGNVVTVGVQNCIIEANKRLIAAVGLDGLVVVDTEDATLIGDKLHIEEIKKVLEQLRHRPGGEDYL